MKSLICIDASVVIRLLIGGEGAEQVAALWAKWKSASQQLVAPSLLSYEVANALHQYVRHGYLQSDEAADALRIALSLNIQLYRDVSLHIQAATLARELDLRATYDAHYLALAQQMDAVFYTADQRLLQQIKPKLSFARNVTAAD